MIRLTIKQLIDLAASGAIAPEVRIEKAFEWAHARRLELVRWILAVAGALLVPVAIAFVRGEVGKETSAWWLVASVFGAVLLALLGVGMLLQAGQIHRTYIATQSLLGEINKIGPFIQRYREEIERRWRP
jgi:RsiW-degrading membrane proteinase PrsW (M82 family)